MKQQVNQSLIQILIVYAWYDYFIDQACYSYFKLIMIISHKCNSLLLSSTSVTLFHFSTSHALFFSEKLQVFHFGGFIDIYFLLIPSIRFKCEEMLEQLFKYGTLLHQSGPILLPAISARFSFFLLVS